MAETGGDKSQEPTTRRRQQARDEGQVAKSQDMASAVMLIAGIGIVMLLGGKLADFMAALARQQLGGEAWLSADQTFIVHQWGAVMSGLAPVVLPVLGLVLLVGVLVNISQVGFLFLPNRLAPDISRINPLKGLKRLFSLASLMRVLFGTFKILIIAAVAIWSLYGEIEQVVALPGLAPGPIAHFLSETLLWISLKVGLALLILAILDFAYQRWKHEQDLRMSIQEVREEMKNLQGDPQVIARRRAVQRQLILNRISTAVPKADVVITNPTELAIAVQYDAKTMMAPVVVAKGAGTVAARIRRLAVEHNVPIVEKKPLAQALYKQVDVSQPIPTELYTAVAEVLAYVYRLKGKPLPAPPGGGEQRAA